MRPRLENMARNGGKVGVKNARVKRGKKDAKTKFQERTTQNGAEQMKSDEVMLSS